MRIHDAVMLAVGMSLATGAAGVGAQSSAGAAAGLEEIVVSARKRDESIQAAPLAVQALSAAQIEERGISSISELSKFTPGLTFTGGTSRASSAFSIRGLTQINAVGDNRRDLVTVFVDGVPIVGNPSVLGSEDLVRVEVIKGPQSALFGRATFGGAVSLITATPGDELKGRVSVTLGSYGDNRVSGAIEGPIVDGILAAGIMADTTSFDGYYRNALTGNKLGSSDRNYYSATLSFTPVESFKAKLRYSKRHDVDGEAATPLVARYTEHNCGPFPGFTPRTSLGGLPAGFTQAQSRRAYCGELKAPSAFGINENLPTASLGKTKFDTHKLVLDHSLFSGSAEWSFLDGHTLTFTGSHQQQEIVSLADFERAAEDRYQAFADTIQPQNTYELRFASPAKQRLTYMLGVSYLKSEFSTAGAFINGALFGAAAGGPTTAVVPAVSDALTKSVFGSVGFDLTDRLNLTAELRRQKDRIGSGVGLPTRVNFETTANLPRVLALFKLNSENNVYANYARGNQPTQGYATYYQLTPAQQAVASANGINATAPEAIVKNYEIGLKHREDDGRWYLNTSLFYLEWVGRQALATLQVDLDRNGIIDVRPAPQGEVFNVVPVAAGDSNTRGVEIEGAYRLSDSVTVGGNVAYADTEITKALNEPLLLRFYGRTDGKGQEFPLVPKISGAAFAQYENSIAAERTLFVRTDVTYIGKRWDSILNLAYVPPQVRANLRAGVRSGAWEITAFINNLFDDRTLEAARFQSDSAADPFSFQLAASEAVMPNKRQIGLTATVRF